MVLTQKTNVGIQVSGYNQEIDVEILGNDPTKVLFTVWTNDGENGGMLSKYSETLNLRYDASNEFHTYAFNWQDNKVDFYVYDQNGKARLKTTIEPKYYELCDCTLQYIPNKPCTIRANCWFGLEEWPEAYSVNPETGTMYVDYIRFTPAY